MFQASSSSLQGRHLSTPATLPGGRLLFCYSVPRFSEGKFCIVKEVNDDMGVSVAVVKEREESDTCMAVVVIG